MVRKRPNSQSESRSATTQVTRLLDWIRPICLFVLGLLICWAMLHPLDSTSVFDGSAQPQNLGYFLLAVFVSLDLILNRRINQLTILESACLIGMGLWMLVVTLQAAQLSNPRTGWNGFWHLLGGFSLYFSLRNLLIDTRLRSASMLILLGGATAVASIGVFQVAVEFPRARAEYRANPEEMISQLGLEAPPGSPLRLKLENRLNSPEPLGTFSLANSLAVLLSGGLVLVIGALAFDLVGQSTIDHQNSADSNRSSSSTRAPKDQSSARQMTVLPKIVAVALVLLIGIAWFLTRSRVAFLAVPLSLLLLASGAYWQFGGRLAANLSTVAIRWIKRLMTGLCVLILMGGIWLSLKDPLVFTEAAKSLSYRFEYWAAAVEIIKDHALLGIGLGNFQTFYPAYMSTTASETIADPHNWILDIASTCSLPIAAVMVIGFARLLIKKPTETANTANSSSSGLPLLLGATVGGLAVLVGLTLFGLDDRTAITTLLAMLVAVVASYGVRQLIVPFVDKTTLGPTIMAIAMLLCLLVSGSWQATGLMAPLVCCLVCSQKCAEPMSPIVSRATSWARNLPLAITLSLLVGFLWQSWNPVLHSNSEVNKPFRSLAEQLKLVENARRIDPQNSQWDRFRAQLLVELALDSSENSTFEVETRRAVQAIETWADREPTSFLTGQFAGDRIMQLIEVAERRNLDSSELRYRANKYYASAVKARPNSVGLRIQLAYSHFLLADAHEAENEIAEAMKISDNTPHEDQKLKAQQIWIPGAPSELSRQNSGQPYYQAELVVAWIRKQMNP